jgi:hypothetical protein
MDDYTIPITKPANQFAGNSSQPKQETTYPSEVVDLPSQGHFYPSSSPLSNGTINLKIMTAKEEDILTNQNYIKKGIVLDKLIESLIVDKDVKLDDLLLGDKNAIFVATRRFAYGDSYGPLQIKCPSCRENNECTFNLGELSYKQIDFSKYEPNVNNFDVQLPYCKKTVTCKLLTSGDEKQIENEIKVLQKIKTGNTAEVTTRLRYTIVAIDGNSNKQDIQKFVENELTSRDSLELRKQVKERTPDIDLNFNFKCEQCNHEERLGVPLTVQFFWPDSAR